MKRHAFGLVGHPLGHSLSPALHHAALAAAGLEGGYALFPIPPGPDCERKLRGLLAQLRGRSLDGLNVTLPYKSRIITFLDRLGREATRFGAVNTIHLSSFGLVGENTDAPAFWHDLQSNPDFLQPKAGRALVLGAGGSACAVSGTLAEHGWQVWIAARLAARAGDLASRLRNALPSSSISDCALSDIPSLVKKTHLELVINATPVGMSPEIDLSPWPPGLSLPPSASIYDLVYNPMETRLLQQARRQGLPARGGLGMLVEQAALAFEIWTGRAADRKTMEAAALGALAQEA